MEKIQIDKETQERIETVVGYISTIVNNRGLFRDIGGFRLAHIYAMDLVELFDSTNIHITAKDIENAGQ